jgi:5-hydroxyisourate hydrolase
VTLSTHVLDISKGRPAAGVPVRLETEDGRTLADGRTDGDGRIKGWDLEKGVHRLVFGTGDYLGPEAFYPQVVVAFRVADPTEHHHVPLLLSPFGYSTYRGS